MANDIQVIEEFFASHDGDGEFGLHPRSAPYSVIWPRKGCAHLMLTTKPHFVAALAADTDEALTNGVAMIGGSGLPNADDVHLLGSLSDAVAVWFLGDLDPPDLMIYAWLRGMLPLRHVNYLGIGDKLLEFFAVGVGALTRIELAPSERESLVTLQRAFPDVRDTVGSLCTDVLMGGNKVELEALLHRRDLAEGIFSSLRDR
ncbi:MAG TPA: hypothetical protein VFI31_09335 [Pirellulales bacterium]|nr:hypothetical protein [Pirellulales bacterium]